MFCKILAIIQTKHTHLCPYNEILLYNNNNNDDNIHNNNIFKNQKVGIEPSTFQIRMPTLLSTRSQTPLKITINFTIFLQTFQNLRS